MSHASHTAWSWMSNRLSVDFCLLKCSLMVSQLYNPTNYERPDTFAPRPLQTYHRYYESVCQPDPQQYACSVESNIALFSRHSLLWITEPTISGHAFSRSLQKPQTELTPPPHRTPSGQ